MDDRIIILFPEEDVRQEIYGFYQKTCRAETVALANLTDDLVEKIRLAIMRANDDCTVVATEGEAQSHTIANEFVDPEGEESDG